MKVLYVTNSIGLGGDSIALLNILEYTIPNGIIPLITCPATGEFTRKLEEMKIPYVVINNQLEIYPRIHSWRSYIKYPYTLLKLLLKQYLAYKRLCTCIHKFQPDIIHTNVGPIHIGYLAAKKYAIPHVWHIREYQLEDFDMHPFPSTKTFLKRIHDKSNHCICITKNIFEHFKLNPLKDYVIYDGVINKKEIIPINKNKKTYILFAGRLEDAKGIKELIYAYNKYAQNGGKYKLYIAGKGNEKYKQECLHLLQKQIRDRVSFLGECEHKIIYELMYNASIFVVPSRNEGFGFITAEAMFNGTIVIGKNTGGTKEQMDNGKIATGKEIAFRYNTPQELTNLLFKVQNLNKDLYWDIANEAQQVVCKLYDKEIQSKKFKELYNHAKSNITT